MPDGSTPAAQLAEIRKDWPEAVRLAEPLALAARIEPELLREVRLTLFPKSQASLEAELYFSPLVAQRTPQWLVLDPVLGHELQNGLASLMKRRPKARLGIERVRELVERAHVSARFEIAREEEMIWLSVARPLGKAGARKAIDEILHNLLRRLLASGGDQGAIARWFASAARRLPSLARETPAFALLGFAASSVLSGRRIDTRVEPTLETFEALTVYLPHLAQRTTVWAALTTRGLHIMPREATGYQALQVPLTNPVLLEIRGKGGSARLVPVQRGQPLFVPLSGTPIAVRTLARDLLTFSPRRVTGVEAQGTHTSKDMGTEWVIVKYPRVRDVFIDGRRSGQANEILIVGKGKHTFDLGTPIDYRPSRRTVTVASTSAVYPVEIVFEPV